MGGKPVFVLSAAGAIDLLLCKVERCEVSVIAVWELRAWQSRPVGKAPSWNNTITMRTHKKLKASAKMSSQHLKLSGESKRRNSSEHSRICFPVRPTCLQSQQYLFTFTSVRLNIST
jgi:hypothetical protein